MKRHPRLLLVLLCLTGAVALGSPGGNVRAAGAATPALLKVLFNPDGTIAVSLGDGTSVGGTSSPGTVIPAGVYNVHIDDHASVAHLFHLFGPSVYVSTNPMTAGPDGEAMFDEFYEVTFLPGSTYTFQDDYAPGASRRVFSTSSGGAAATGSTATSTGTSGKLISGGSVSGTKQSQAKKTVAQSPAHFEGVLAAGVGTGGTPELIFKGKPVRKLSAGRYTISVDDQSREGGFIIQQARKSAQTVSGISFVGKRSTSILLRPGQWFFYPTFVGKKTYFIVIG